MWVDYRGSLSTVHNDGEILTCGYVDYRGPHSTVYTKSALLIRGTYFTTG